MKDIDRYYAHIKNGNALELRYSLNDCGDIVKYTDHKAIVEEYKEMLIKANEGFCPERLGYKQDYKYSKNCGIIDCSECLRWYLDNGVKDE